MIKHRKNSPFLCVQVQLLIRTFFAKTHISSFIKSDKSFVLSHKNSDLAGHVSFDERRNNTMGTRVISPVKALL